MITIQTHIKNIIHIIICSSNNTSDKRKTTATKLIFIIINYNRFGVVQLPFSILQYLYIIKLAKPIVSHCGTFYRVAEHVIIQLNISISFCFLALSQSGSLVQCSVCYLYYFCFLFFLTYIVYGKINYKLLAVIYTCIHHNTIIIVSIQQ